MTNQNEDQMSGSDATSVIGKLDAVIEKITKSKKFASVRILEEVRREIIQNGMPANVDAGISRPIVPAVSPQRTLPNGAIPYVQQNGEVDELIGYIGRGHNVLLTGATGCGKTHLVKHVAALMGKNLYTIQGEEGMRKEDIVGYRDIEKGDTAYTYGVLPRSMQDDAGLAYWDEPNATPAGIQFVCFAAMDRERRSITLTESKGGEVITAKAGFTFVGAMNEGRGYRGTSSLNDAMRARWGAIIDLDYLPEARERKLLVDRTGIDPNIAAKLAAAARQLRTSAKQGTITTPISTRSLLAACDGIMGGIAVGRAVELSIINQVAGTKQPERKAFSDVMAAHNLIGKGAK